MTIRQRRRVSPEQIRLMRELARKPLQLSTFDGFASGRHAKVAARRLEALGLVAVELVPHPEADRLTGRCGNRRAGVLTATLTPAGEALLDLEDAKARFAEALL